MTIDTGNLFLTGCINIRKEENIRIIKGFGEFVFQKFGPGIAVLVPVAESW